MIYTKQIDEQISIIIRKAEILDVKDLWVWRNDLYTRLMSLKTDFIDWESHKVWFEKLLKNNKSIIFIGYDKNNQKIGMCRFDINKSQSKAIVSINLNPEFRNKKLSYPLLKLSIKEFSKTNKFDLIAEIRQKNILSIKCFIKCGFLFEYSNSDFGYYKKASD
jgi:hypothetical protein